MSALADPCEDARNVRRARVFWGGIVWAIFGVLVGFGSGYAIAGLGGTAAPAAFQVFIEYVPGDLHTYGWTLLVLAALLLHGLLPGRGVVLDIRWLVPVLYIVGGGCFLIVWLFLWSWLLSGTPTWQAMIYWTGETTAAWLCAKYTPPKPVAGCAR